MSTQLDLAKMAIAGLSKKDRMLLLSELQPGAGTAVSEQRIIRRKEAARRLSCSLRLIDKLSRQGILQRVKLPGRVHSAGYRLSEVEKLIGGAA